MSRRRGPSAAFAIAFTGLSTDSLGSYGLIGDHAAIGFTIDPVLGGETHKWSNSSNPADAATFGTGAAPTDFVSVDGFAVWLHVTQGTDVVSRSFPARRALATAAGAIAAQTWTVDDTVVNLNAATDFTAGGNTLTYSASGLPAGVTINSAGTISGTPTAVSSGSVVVTATDAYGRLVTSTFTQASALRTQATAPASIFALTLRRDAPLEDVFPEPEYTLNGNTGTWSATGLPTNMSIGAETGEVSGFPTTLQSASNATYTFTDTYGRQTSTTQSITVADVPSIFIAANLTITPDGVGGFDVTVNALPAANGLTITDVEYLPPGGTWQAAGSTSAFTVNGTEDGTASWGFRAVNSLGGLDTEAAYAVNVTITGTASAPVLDTVSLTRNNDGTPADAALGYTGTITGYRIYVATGGVGLTVNAAQLYAGSGGSDVAEFTDFATGTDIPITGLTAASNGAAQMAFALITSADGSGASNVVLDDVPAGLAFAFPTVTWATNTAGTQIIGTAASGNLYFSQDAADWAVGGVSGASVSTVTGSGTGTITLALTGGTAVPADTVTLSYTDSDTNLRDQDGNEAANFSGTSVTNNVPVPASFTVTVLPVASTSSSTTTPTVSLDLTGFGTGDIVGVVYGPGQFASSATLAGNAMTKVGDTSPGAAQGRLAFFTYTLTGAGGATDSLVMTLPGSTNRHIMSAFVAKSGQIAASAFARIDDGANLSAAVAPTKANNVILGFTMGENTSFGDGITWVNATEQRENATVVSVVGESYARADDVAIASITLEANATGTPTNDRGIVVIAIEEAD